MSKLVGKMVPALSVCLIGYLTLSAPFVKADTPSEDGGRPAADVLGSGLSNFYLVLEVLFFLAVLLGIFFILIRLLAKRNQAGAFGSRPVRSIGGVPLGQNKSVQLVAIGKAIYIIGVGDNVQLLEKIDNEQEVEELTELLSAQHGAMPEFLTVGNWLKRLRERRMPIEEEELPSSSFGQVFQEKLQQISSTKKRNQELLEHKHDDDDRYDP